jgi:hypothetical protein
MLVRDFFLNQANPWQGSSDRGVTIINFLPASDKPRRAASAFASAGQAKHLKAHAATTKMESRSGKLDKS